jgi:ubiquinone/menaquinone biosynthesis C-methylase UbiE
MLGLPSPGRVLDVGSGTGVALLPAVKAVGPGGLVVGLDPSVEMLRIAQSKKLTPLVVAEVPGVPFANGTFDVVLANFVVSHFTHYDVALVDMVRVLRRGGQLGVTAWGPSQSVYSEVWREVAGSFVSKDLLLDASRQGVPWAWEEWFSEPIHVREALQDAGLIKVKVRRREYRTVMSVAAYLIARETSLQGRFMRQTLTKAQWKHFQESAAEEFRSRFGDSIRYTGEVHLAVSTRP